MSVRRFVVVGVVVVLVLMSLAVLGGLPAAARGVNERASSSPVTSASQPSADAAASVASPAATASRAALAQSILQRLRDAKVPMTAVYLPNLLTEARTSKGYVEPGYTAAPAPMGVGDFGVRNTTGTAEPYFLQSTSWKGVLTLNDVNALYLDNGAPDYLGAQLNTVMANTTVQGNTTNSFWIQNVISYSTLSHSLTFIDNIWNFSSPSFSEWERVL
jgi:thermopsin